MTNTMLEVAALLLASCPALQANILFAPGEDWMSRAGNDPRAQCNAWEGSFRKEILKIIIL